MLNVKTFIASMFLGLSFALACNSQDKIELRIEKSQSSEDHLLHYNRGSQSWTVVDNDGILSLSVLLEHINYSIKTNNNFCAIWPSVKPAATRSLDSLNKVIKSEFCNGHKDDVDTKKACIDFLNTALQNATLLEAKLKSDNLVDLCKATTQTSINLSELVKNEVSEVLKLSHLMIKTDGISWEYPLESLRGLSEKSSNPDEIETMTNLRYLEDSKYIPMPEKNQLRCGPEYNNVLEITIKN